jgi:hypothetical protein
MIARQRPEVARGVARRGRRGSVTNDFFSYSETAMPSPLKRLLSAVDRTPLAEIDREIQDMQVGER